MLTKNKNPKVSYISRLLALPLAAIVFFAFTIKMKAAKASPLYDGKTITVVIDAGHGGEDNGAVENNINEKDLTLAIAKQVKELNGNKKINIILTRDKDEYMSVKDKINFSNVRKADLFISIHIDKEEKKNLHSGLDIFIPKNDNAYLEQSRLLGSSIIESFRSNYPLPVANDLKQRNYTPWVLKANQCPAIVIEAGFLSSKKDFDYLTKSSSQQAIARNILNGIENYAEQSLSNADSTPEIITADSLIQYLTIRSDSANPVYYIDGKEISKDEKIPSDSIQSITVLKGQNAIKKYGDKGKKGVIEITTKYNIPSNTFIIIDGEESSRDELNKIPRDNIESVTILKGESAIKKYGEKARYGSIEIITKKEDDVVKIYADTISVSGLSGSDNVTATGKAIFIEPEFPPNVLIFVDGKETSKEEIKNVPPNTLYSINVLKGETAEKKYGDKGKNGAIEITTKKAHEKNHTQLYLPGSQKDSIPGKIFTKVEIAASFPGGPEAWQKYITKKIQAELSSFTTADFGTCILRFIVNPDGTVRDVIATTKKGTQLAKMAINAVKNGPKWIPASQNGHIVASYRLQPVTLMNPNASNTNSDASKIFVKVENAASFPGGSNAWQKYIARCFQASLDPFTKADFGTCILRFIVNTDGTVSDVRATTMKGTQLAKMAVSAVKKGPKWTPASQNGHTVASYRLQPVTLTNPDAFNKTPSKLKQSAGSEDGQVALSKYITRTIQKEPITFRVGDIIRNEIEPE